MYNEGFPWFVAVYDSYCLIAFIRIVLVFFNLYYLFIQFHFFVVSNLLSDFFQDIISVFVDFSAFVFALA